MSDELIRPNGKRYKPKKPPSVIVYNDRHGCEAVAVMRTHDFDLACKLASGWIDALGLQPDRASEDWWRLVPFDPNHSGYDSNWITDTVRGVPCVVIPHD